MVKKSNLNRAEVEAAQSVMFDLMALLSPFRNHLVLIGGSVPRILFPHADKPHVGSLDVDLVLDGQVVGSPDMAVIETMLIQNGYRQSDTRPHIFYMKLSKEGKEYEIQVDLLTSENTGSKGGVALAVHGCDLAFEEPIEEELLGVFPDGSQRSVVVRFASIVPMICMKAMALMDRGENKDAYDLYYCVRNYEAGIESLALEFKKLRHIPEVEEGIKLMKEAFSSVESKGPRGVVEFLGGVDVERRDQNARDAFERINALLVLL
jgi:hypothetical protein